MGTETSRGKKGRPRSEPARQAILAAATDLLLARGLSAVSMDAVAERAGVSKATIYRWWPTKETLALDALYGQLTEPSPDPPDSGSLETDLTRLLTGLAERAQGSGRARNSRGQDGGSESARAYARVIGALVAEAATDEAFGELYRARYIEPRRAQVRAVLKRAVERGDLPAGTDVETAIDLLYGPVYHRLLHGHAELTGEFAAHVVRTVITGLCHTSGGPDILGT